MKKAIFIATVDVHIKTFHLPYLKMLHENNYVVHVATNGQEKFPNCDKKHTIAIKRTPFSFSNLKTIRQLRKILEEEHFDIIHCHTPMGGVVARLAAKSFNKSQSKKKLKRTRVIYTAHGFHFYRGAPLLNWLLFYPVEKYLSKHTDTLITINQEDFNLATKKFKRHCGNIEYIPGVGIDPKKFDFKMSSFEKHNLRKSLDLKNDDFVMIFPARLDKNKNQEFLISLMPELTKKHSNIHLILAGRDELSGKCQRLTKSLHIDKNVHFTGHRNDIPQLLAISDLAVSSSRREGFPMNIAEELYSKLPVVAIKCRGASELIKDGVNGFLIKPYEKQDFINSVEKIYSTSSNRTNFRQKYLDNFSLNSVMQDYCRVYSEVNIDNRIVAKK